MTAVKFVTRIETKKTDTPRVWLRVDKAHVAKVIKARREMCFGEGVRA